MSDDPIRYCYSTDEERYQGDFATREEAADAAFIECDEEDREGQEIVWTAVATKPQTEMLLPDGDDLATLVIERMQERASEIWDEAEWPDTDRDDERDLGRRLLEAVKAWAAERVDAPTFWECHKIQAHTRTVATGD